MCDKADCNSSRIVTITAKCSDCFSAHFGHTDIDYDGYVLDGLGIGSDDYVQFAFCLDCGKIQGRYPLADPEVVHA